MRILRHVAVAVVALASTASMSSAQNKGFWEFGTDVLGWMNVSPDGGSSYSTFALGGSAIRAGKFIGDRISVEPQLSWSHTSGSGFSSTYTYIEIGALYHFQTNPDAGQFYVRPLLDINLSSSSSGSFSSSDTRTGFGAGVGYKMRAKKMKKLIMRTEANFRTFASKGSLPAYTQIGISLGAGVDSRP